jgi:phenylalanyl-tRNA synthetase beta chain
LKRAASLIKEIAGGAIAMEVVDINENPTESIKVDFDYNECNKLIGQELSRELINNILTNLDFNIGSEDGSQAEIEIPAYRNDVTRQADIVEEVLRIYGYNNVSLPNKMTSSIGHFSKPDPEKVQSIISEMLVGMGCFETLNNSLTKSKYSVNNGGEVVKEVHNVNILNPLSQDLNVMRQSLIFNCLETIEYNQNRQHPDLKIFEFGKVYHKYDSGYSENRRLLIAVTGNKEEENWNSSSDKVSFFSIKGIAKAVVGRLGLETFLKEKSLRKSLLQDGIELHVLKSKIGELGWVPKNMLSEFGIKNEVFIADLDWDALLDSLKLASIKFKELPKSFAVRRDFSLLLDQKVKFSEIESISKKCDNKLLTDIGLFDVYEGDKLKEGTKSYAVSFLFQDNEKTLKDAQVDTIMDKIRSALESELGAELR